MRCLLLIVLAGCVFNLISPSAMAADTIDFCATGTMTMGPFDEHIAEIRKANRYEKADIDELIAEQKAGGPDFFSTQVVIKEEQSGSGDFDLHLFQGFSDPQAKYNVTRNGIASMTTTRSPISSASRCGRLPARRSWCRARRAR